MNPNNSISPKDQLKDWLPELLNAGKSVWINSRGFSMYPILKPGDQLKVMPIGITEIRVGDIIAFQQKGILVAHRVQEIRLDKEGLTLTAKGDSVFEMDEEVSDENYLGKITALKRKGVEQPILSSKKKSIWYTYYCFFRKTIKGYFRLG